MDVAPGTRVAVEITAAPTNEAARKTLTRVCSKDAEITKAQRWKKARRPSWQTWRRGGKMWHHQMKSRSPVVLEPGSKYSVLATVDVLRDLRSVQRFVNIAAS